ncbi:MAG: 3-hydroxyacyl-ACP dehydratase [Ferruginibacter sp.]|nr:3-hydroxyacyl-ACP dehydratase [Ferruginibacter sp.]
MSFGLNLQLHNMTSLTDNIISFIPQRPPFVMIDRLTGNNENATSSSFLVKADNILVENGQLPEAGLVENIAQTAAAREGYLAGLQNKPVRVGYIGAVKNLVVYALPSVNDELRTEITIQNQIFDVTLIRGSVRSREVLLAECEMKIFISQSK